MQWKPFESHGKLFEAIAIRCTTISSHLKPISSLFPAITNHWPPLESHWKPWEVNGSHWNSSESHWKASNFNAFPMASTGASVASKGFQRFPNGSQWTWQPMWSHEKLLDAIWKPLKAIGRPSMAFQWCHWGFNGFQRQPSDPQWASNGFQFSSDDFQWLCIKRFSES